MKTIKAFVGVMAVAGVMASCLKNEESYRAGFQVDSPTNSVSSYYANNVSDSLVFFGYGNWEIVDAGGYDNKWLTVPTRMGKGGVIYGQQLAFEQNTTGKSRTAVIQINDTSHPDDAHCSLAFTQFATRGDGTLGNAADVKSITGSDGSNVTLEYDVQHRPTLVKIQKGEQTLSSLQLSYSAKQMTVKDGNGEFRVAVDNDYQPMMLVNGNDTIGYFTLLYPNAVPIALNYTFNFKHNGSGKSSCVTYSFGYTGCSLAPDSLHNADSLVYYQNNVRTMQLGLTYADVDNRCQSVDVNQLLLGIEACDPYLLASLFRYARNSHVISKAKHGDVEIDVVTTLNADKSIRTLAVKRGNDTVTYTFNY